MVNKLQVKYKHKMHEIEYTYNNNAPNKIGPLVSNPKIIEIYFKDGIPVVGGVSFSSPEFIGIGFGGFETEQSYNPELMGIEVEENGEIETVEKVEEIPIENNDYYVIHYPQPEYPVGYTWSGDLEPYTVTLNESHTKYSFNDSIFPKTIIKVGTNENVELDCTYSNIIQINGNNTLNVKNLNLDIDVSLYDGVYEFISMDKIMNPCKIFALPKENIIMKSWNKNTSSGAKTYWLNDLDYSENLHLLQNSIFVCISNTKKNVIGAHKNVLSMLGIPFHYNEFNIVFDGVTYTKQADEYTYGTNKFYRIYDTV